MTSNIRTRLREQGCSVRHLAHELDVPLKTVQDWVYRGKSPSAPNQELLDLYMTCTHYWVIDVPNGPISRGTCKVCGEVRYFNNSIEASPYRTSNANQRTASS